MTRTLVILSVVKTASKKKKSRAPKRVHTFPWEISPEVNLIVREKRDHHYCLPKLFHQVEPAILEKKYDTNASFHVKQFNFYFSEFFATFDKIFSLGVRLGTRF